jgi:hypothetical protein
MAQPTSGRRFYGLSMISLLNERGHDADVTSDLGEFLVERHIRLLKLEMGQMPRRITLELTSCSGQEIGYVGKARVQSASEPEIHAQARFDMYLA